MMSNPDPIIPDTSPAAAVGEEALLCPGCGYDLRGTPGERCSECGLAFDREMLKVSGFPWAHRGRIGWVRAYVKTAWLVTIDSRVLRYEAARAQDPADGRAFARVTAGIVAGVLLGIFAVAALANKGLGFLAVQPQDLMSLIIGRGLPAWCVDDVLAPWSAGATFWVVPPVCLILLAGYLACVQRAIFRLSAVEPAQRRRSVALASYASAPLACALPAIGAFLAAVVVGLLATLAGVGRTSVPWRVVVLALLIVSALLGTWALAGTVRRCGQWMNRTLHCCAGRAVLGCIELLVLWGLGIVVLLGLLPWCVGFLWIVIDSFR